MKTINIGFPIYSFGLCYVPDPHRLLVVCDSDKVRAMSCDDSKEAWKVETRKGLGYLLYAPRHKTIFVTFDVQFDSRFVVLNPSNGVEIQSIPLPDNMHEIQGVCLFNDQTVVASEGGQISYFSLT